MISCATFSLPPESVEVRSISCALFGHSRRVLSQENFGRFLMPYSDILVHAHRFGNPVARHPAICSPAAKIHQISSYHRPYNDRYLGSKLLNSLEHREL